jgi:hypothetical protein
MKKIVIFLLIILIPSLLFAEAPIITFVRSGRFNEFPQTMLILESIIECDRSELRILRNAFYAKYGYIFSSPDLNDFFNQLDWYEGTMRNVESYLTADEKLCIARIQRIEANYPQYVDDNLVGYWAEMSNVSHVDSDILWRYFYWLDHKNSPDFDWYNHIKIYPNGVFYFQDDWFYNITGTYAIGVYGLWSFTNNEFSITPLVGSTFDPREIGIIENLIRLNISFKYTSSNEFYTRERRDFMFLECNFTNDSRRWIRFSSSPLERYW